MKNLVFRLFLTVTLCWQNGIAERSANGYFYDKPEGTLFDESPGRIQVTNSAPLFPPVEVSNTALISNEASRVLSTGAILAPQPPTTLAPLFPPVEVSNNALISNEASRVISTGGYFPQLLAPQAPAPQPINRFITTYEIIPAKLIYEDTQLVAPSVRFGLQQQRLTNVQNFGNILNLVEQQPIYRAPAGVNLQPIAFNTQDSNQAFNTVQQACGPEPIVAQFNPQLVDLSNGGPLTRLITTCGPNNDCNSIQLQSDVNRQLGVFSSQRKISSNADLPQVQPRTSVTRVLAEQTPLVRPPGRRLIQYSETERDDPHN